MHVEVDPLILRQAAIEFQVADGLVPTDKLMNIDSWQAFMQMIGSSESLQQEYDMGDLLSYLMKMQGADVAEFQKPKDLMLFQQQLTAWQQAAAMATKAGTPFSTPMPQIPQSVIEEMQKKQAMDAAKKPTASLQEQIAGAAAAASGPSGKTNGTGTATPSGTLPQANPPAVGQTGVPNA